LKEYPPGPSTPVKAAIQPKKVTPKKGFKSSTPKTGREESKSGEKKQRKKDVLEDRTDMERKALNKAKRKNKHKHKATKNETSGPAKEGGERGSDILGDKEDIKMASGSTKTLGPERSRSPTKRNERKRRRKEAGSAKTSKEDEPSPEVGDEIIAIQATSSDLYLNVSSGEIAEEVMAIQSGSYASLESMFQEAPFGLTPLLNSEVIIQNRKDSRLAPHHKGSKPDRQVGSKRLEYFQMSGNEKTRYQVQYICAGDATSRGFTSGTGGRKAPQARSGGS